MTKPIRIQRKRTKGWRMPDNTVVVTRGTKWGNPFVVNPNVRAGSGNCYSINVPSVEDAVECFREMLNLPERAGMRAAVISELRGKNLACFCALDQSCHADVLLEIANS